ncbi:HNH endonuclease signature motif containing protein [Rhodococcus daqingensis]|uniref:HNH endonuclease signature motif containing protein n=1 Tax=Rhodococcus daqingensis TaxID=2479363 RepID=A0ABW2S4F1_9NOCA
MKYTKEILQAAVENSTSVAGVLRYLDLAATGGSHAHLSRRIKKLGIDTSHFTGGAHLKGRPAPNRLTPADILVVRPPGSPRVKPHQLRRALIEAGVPHLCAACGIGPVWNGWPLTLHVDHINGDYLDSRLENLRFLCPNCHTQTASWAGRNRAARPASDTPPDDAVA